MALVLPATALASPHSYRLKGKKCKHGYARKVRHVKGHRQVWCVRRKPAPHAVAPAPAGPTATQTIVTAVNSSGSPLPGQPSYISVGVNVRAAGQELNGYPVRLQIEDMTAGGAVVGSFIQPSRGHAYCSVVYRLEGPNVVFTGQAVPPDEACSLRTITVPQGHLNQISGAFAGTEKLLPSSSTPQTFYA